MYRFSWDELAAVYNTNPDLDAFDTVRDDDDTPRDAVLGFFVQSPRVVAWLALHGLLLDDDGATVVKSTAMRMAGWIACLVSKDYDSLENLEGDADCWNALGLTGDDSVDYNGSHLDMLLEVIYELLPEDYREMREPSTEEEADLRKALNEWANGIRWDHAYFELTRKAD